MRLATDSWSEEQLQEVIARLNAIVELEPQAMHYLCESRISVRNDLADRTHAVVVHRGGVDFLGMLGVINALFGTEDHPAPIVAIYNDDDTLLSFERNYAGTRT